MQPLGPPMLTILYLLIRDRIAFAVVPQVELAIQIALLISGGGISGFEDLVVISEARKAEKANPGG
jgi:hypothetical protein